MKMKSNPIILGVVKNGTEYFQIQDTPNEHFQERKLQRFLEIYQSYFVRLDELLIDRNINYVNLQELIEKISRELFRVCGVLLDVAPEVQAYISQNQYAINEHRIAGGTIKQFDERWDNEIDLFNHILAREITRPLKKEQVQSSFYLAMMKKAANFSVPGAGKTAMMYGAFAYLSSREINKVSRIIVVSPINAFEAWRTEYIEVFGQKRSLRFMNLRDPKYRNKGKMRSDFGSSDVIVINYEALEGKISVLNELIDETTMIVFDEVHRVKGIGGKRAKAALSLGPKAMYRFVLTGTPIPNGYEDIYNFLHLLYGKEYDSYFGWEVNELFAPKVDEVNDKLNPFFWRTTKKDLKVPNADPDQLIVIEPSAKQEQLLQAIYENEGNILGLYIRLLQASTNPSLLLDKINYQDFGFLSEEIELTQFSALNDTERELARIQAYKKLQVESISSPKFEKGIQLIEELVRAGKKVIVWGIFVKSMQKIRRALLNKGISVNLVYGGTPKDERVDLINAFRDGNVEVMVSNPNTLGESISLHQTVHDAVYFEYNFNLTFMLQSRDRIHRLGLKESQYTRYYYLMSSGDRAHCGFIDQAVYERLKEKEEIMLNAIEGDLLLPEVTDSYLEDVKNIIG